MTEKEVLNLKTLYRLVPDRHDVFECVVCHIYQTHRTLKDNPFPMHIKFRFKEKDKQKNHSFTATKTNLDDMETVTTRYFTSKDLLLEFVINNDIRYRVDEDMQKLIDAKPHLFC